MIATKTKFSLSANIQRDLDSPFSYIPTPNAKQVFEQILSDFTYGNRAFNIIGAYGTGKSSFLLAFYQTLSGNYNHFSESKKITSSFGNIEFIELVGSFNSITQSFAERFQIKYSSTFKVSNLLSEISSRCKLNHKRNRNTVIVIDEFGKFLEYAAKNNPEEELYFIQQLAELANDEKNNLLLLTTLHQDFGAYAFDLTKAQRNEWSKVKGRLKEITFNEPVEQLLYLAAKRMFVRGDGKADKDFQKLFDSIRDAKAFPLRDYFNEDIAQKLLPFDILSAAVLTLSLQRYGQNERSLFSFLESKDIYGINDYNSLEEPYYNLACVHDYLAHNYYSFISTNNNHSLQWNLLKKSIERIEGIETFNGKQLSDAIKLVKSIGLLNIFATASAKLTKSFLSDYAKYSLGVRNAEHIIETLEKHKVIRYVNYAFKYILFEGTDMNIDLAIDEAGNLIEQVTSVVHHLQQNFEFPFLLAKKEFFETGTPRFFQFQISDQPINLVPEDEIDGYINLVFSHNPKPSEIKRASENCTEAILYGCFKNTKEIQKLLFEIQKVNKVIEMNPDDKVAVRELKGILQHNRNLLNYAVMDSFYKPEIVEWYFNNEKLTIKNSTQLNQKLSLICNAIYSETPHFKNEMVNKTKISSQISLARRDLVTALLEKSDKENIGLDENRFPPEKTIYLSLLKETGIHNNHEGFWQLSQPTDDSFQVLWEMCSDFVLSSRTDKRNLQELVDSLLRKPIKLKKGFLDFWLCVFLISQRDEFALYDDTGNYVPEINSEVLDLLVRKPANFSIKAFDVAGIRLALFKRYRALINQSKDSKLTNKSFIETIRPFLILYKNLNGYSKSTKRISKKALALRDAIANATDPEKTFFEDFPSALGYTLPQLKKEEKLTEKFVTEFQNHIREIQGSYGQLMTLFEDTVKKVLGIQGNFPLYKNSVKQRYNKLKTYLLLPEQKAFYSRLNSELDDRDSYLASIAQACIGKPLDSITDEEESKLHSRFSEFILELDSLSDISKSDVDEANEEVLMFQVSSFVNGISKRILRIPKSQQKDVDFAVQKIKTILQKDTKTNLSILIKLIQEELTNGQ